MLSLISHWRGVAHLGRPRAVLLSARVQIHCKIPEFVLDDACVHVERHSRFSPRHNRTAVQRY